CQQYNTLPPTF
nr:immunoglobulin light chain junction region [Macaca mulatta]